MGFSYQITSRFTSFTFVLVTKSSCPPTAVCNSLSNICVIQCSSDISVHCSVPTDHCVYNSESTVCNLVSTDYYLWNSVLTEFNVYYLVLTNYCECLLEPPDNYVYNFVLLYFKLIWN